MILYLDVGNTSLKWVLAFDGGQRQGGGTHSRQWGELVAELPEQVVTAIWVASVAGPDADQVLSGLLERHYGVRPSFYYSESRALGIRNAYREPERLGVDRWVALVEAGCRHGAALVVDCGTALTIDAVDAEGQHLGGYIVPGLGMLRDGLLRNTARVRVTEVVAPSLALGRSTSACVEHGLLRMSVSFITDVAVELGRTLSDTCPIYLTGGDAEVLRPHLSIPVLQDGDLVLSGLRRLVAAGVAGRQYA